MSGDGGKLDGAGGGGRGRGGRRVKRPLDQASLSELALLYVARFATSRAKLAQYLGRKLRERGWAEEREPDVAGVVERLAGQGFIDDRAFAEAKAASLTRRGFGEGRVRTALSVAGIAEADRSEALAAAGDKAWEAALRFAERKRLGPFAAEPKDQAGRSKALAAMIRAGHGFEFSRRIVNAAPGEELTPE